MTCRSDPKDFAAGRLHADAVEANIRHRTPDPQGRSAAPAGYPMLRSVAAGLRWCARRFLCALDVSRRWQAAVEQAKHCDLIYDPTTGIMFGTREHRDACATARKRAGQRDG
jgi:hypothetical protein